MPDLWNTCTKSCFLPVQQAQGPGRQGLSHPDRRGAGARREGSLVIAELGRAHATSSPHPAPRALVMPTALQSGDQQPSQSTGSPGMGAP